MTALRRLSEEEAALLAILEDKTGVDLAEFAFVDETVSDRCFRLRPHQWMWYQNLDARQIAACARAVGKTLRIVLLACAHVHTGAGTDLFLTAPAKDHLNPVALEVESKLESVRLLKEMLNASRLRSGVVKQPSFEARFVNGARIITRLPKLTGKGLKGQHAKKVIVDECLPAGTLVITRRGFLPIEEVMVGDLVWTHQKRWRPVTATAMRTRPTVLVKGKGHHGLVASTNHPFFASPKLDVIDMNGEPRTVLGRPEWMPASNLEGAYWTACTGVGGKKDLPFESSIWVVGPKRGRLAGFKIRSIEAAWVLGHWVAEGSCAASRASNQGRLDRIYFSIATSEREEVVRRHADAHLIPSGVNKVRDSAFNVTYTGGDYVMLAEWLTAEFGRGAKNKKIPLWVIAEKRAFREAFLEGLIYGDGHQVPDVRGAQARRLTTASRELAITFGVLARSLGYQVSMNEMDHSVYHKEIRKSQICYTVQIGRKGRDVRFDDYLLSRVSSAEPTGKTENLYDLEVEEDQSFTADGFYCHNSQDMPEMAWDELWPTCRTELPDSQILVFGVTAGLNNTFDHLADDMDSPYTLIRKIAPELPDWGPERREMAAKEYGSPTSINYGRNIYGKSVGLMSDLFVTARLMACVRVSETPWAIEFNERVYQKLTLEAASFTLGRRAADMINLPESHLATQYIRFHAGMDIGLVDNPSELLVFGEVHPKGSADSIHRLLTRINMNEVDTPQQVEVIKKVVDFYGDRFVSIALDSTGLGRPIDQLFNETPYRSRVLGYGFAEKFISGFEDRPREPGERPIDLAIKQKTKELGLAEMRLLVDSGRLELPMDVPLLSDWQGAGQDHTLDAAYLFAVSLQQERIKMILESMEPTRIAPVIG